MRRVFITIGLAVASAVVVCAALPLWAGPLAPTGRHCGDVGPLPLDDPTFCGCTWGEVHYRGVPVSGAIVTLSFGSGIVTNVTRLTSLEPAPYYDLTGYDLGARRGDLMTLTAAFGGQTISRTIRAWPEADGEQHVALAIPEQGTWSPWLTGSFTQALAISGNTMWAGGASGVISIDLTSGIRVTQSLPWANLSVRALVIGTNGHVWAAGADGVAEFDGGTWHTHTTPLAGTIRALAVSNSTGAIWAGGDNGPQAQVAIYTGTWSTADTFDSVVTALTVDSMGRAWAATWGSGVFRQNGSGGWQQYQAVNGLASDYVWSAATAGESVWFGTDPYLSGSGPRGGISRYDLATNAWRSYTTAHGLPPDSFFSQAPAAIFALAHNGNNAVWAGTVDGVRFLAEEGWWAAYTTTHGLRSGSVRAIAAQGDVAIATTSAGLDRLNPAAMSGALPVAHIVDVSPLTLTLGTTLTLSGNGQDADELNERIVGWDWSSSRMGPICTTSSCTLLYSLFVTGTHALVFRVQDDEGNWSSPTTTSIFVEESRRTFLPLVLKR